MTSIPFTWCFSQILSVNLQPAVSARRKLLVNFSQWLVCFAAFAALGGCTFLQPLSDPTRFYVLTVPNPTPLTPDEVGSGRGKILLQPVELPAYLKGKSIVVRTGLNEIHLADFDRWAEPLDQGISRVILATLQASRTDSTNQTPDYAVTFRVLACEGMRVKAGKSTVHFAATWELVSMGKSPAIIKHGAFTVKCIEWDGLDFGKLVAHLSEAIADSAKAMAEELQTEPPAPEKPLS